jgi:hypothetical protein
VASDSGEYSASMLKASHKLSADSQLNNFRFNLMKLLLVSPAQSFLTSGLVEIYDQYFCSLLDVYMFGSGASSPMKGGGQSLCVGIMYVAPHFQH